MSCLFDGYVTSFYCLLLSLSVFHFLCFISCGLLFQDKRRSAGKLLHKRGGQDDDEPSRPFGSATVLSTSDSSFKNFFDAQGQGLAPAAATAPATGGGFGLGGAIGGPNAFSFTAPSGDFPPPFPPSIAYSFTPYHSPSPNHVFFAPYHSPSLPTIFLTYLPTYLPKLSLV